MRDVHHPKGGLACNFNGVVAGIPKLVQIYVRKMLVWLHDLPPKFNQC